jgi:hypothetical protein
MAEVHDTTEAVLEALKRGDPVYRPFATFSAARTAIEADRKALAEAGYVIVKVGKVPPWMETVAEKGGYEARLSYDVHGCLSDSLYRVKQ